MAMPRLASLPSSGRHRLFSKHVHLWFLVTQEVQFQFLYSQKQNPPDFSLALMLSRIMSVFERGLIITMDSSIVLFESWDLSMMHRKLEIRYALISFQPICAIFLM